MEGTTPTVPKTMKAIPFPKVCKADDLEITDWPTPEITADDEVIIQVKAFGLNFADIMARKGQYDDAPKGAFVPGYECSGIVAAIGSKVTNCKIGDKVIGGTFNFGSYAQYAKTISDAILPLPEGWTFAQGAGVTVTFITAYHAFFATGWLFPGDKVLIHACAGGVGLAAVQIAKHLQLEIFGTCGSEEKVKFLKERGVHHPINYRTSDFEVEVSKITNKEGVDLIIDSVAGKYLKKDIHILRPYGKLVGIGASKLTDRSFTKTFSIISDVVSMTTMNSIALMLGSKSFVGVNMKRIADVRKDVVRREFAELYKLFLSGTLKPEVQTEWSWTEVVKAHQMLESRGSTGKIVLTIPDS